MPTSVTGPATGRLSIAIRPALGGMRPATHIISVLLPHPEGPTTETKSPLPTSRSIFSSAVTVPSFVANHVLTPLISIMVLGAARSLLRLDKLVGIEIRHRLARFQSGQA